MISYNQMTEERENKIAELKQEGQEVKDKLEALELKHGSTEIQLGKTKEALENAQKDLADTVNKLHSTNKVRHETEIRLGEEVDKTKGLNEVVKLKEEMLQRKTMELEELDKRLLEVQRANEALDTKKQGIERQFELTKK